MRAKPMYVETPLSHFFENWDKSPQKKWDKGVLEPHLILKTEYDTLSAN